MEGCDSRHRHHSSPGLGHIKQFIKACWSLTRINPCHSPAQEGSSILIIVDDFNLNVAGTFVLLLTSVPRSVPPPTTSQSDIRSSTRSFLTTFFDLRSFQLHQQCAFRLHPFVTLYHHQTILSSSGLQFCISRGALALSHFPPIAYDPSVASISACVPTPCLASASFVRLSF
jgi:hypothetical protein